MLLTDLLLQDSTPATRRLFNALAEEPETAAAALVPRIRALAGSGSSIEYLSPADAGMGGAGWRGRLAPRLPPACKCSSWAQLRPPGAARPLPPPRPAALRMLRGLPQVLHGGRFFDREGQRVQRPGERYQANGVRVQVPEAQ